MDQTRSTLLTRVRDPADAEAWGELVVLYEPLLKSYLRHRGLGAEDQRDVVQEVFARLVKSLPNFELDRRRGRCSNVALAGLPERSGRLGAAPAASGTGRGRLARPPDPIAAAETG
jgi:Sigma-70 region 2